MHDQQGSARSAVSGDVDAVKQDIARLRADLAELTQALLAAGQESVRDVNRRLQDEARHRSRQVSDAAGDAVDEVRTRVEEHPLMAIAGSFAVGMVIGLLVDRSRRS